MVKPSTKHWGLLGGKGEGQWEGKVGRDSLGRNAKCGWRGERKQNTLPWVYLRNCLAYSAHVLQNLKCNKKLKIKSGDSRCWRGCEGIGTLLHCWECKLVQPLWKTVWRFLKALEIEIPFDPAIPLLGIYPKEYKSFYYKDTCTWMFIAALFTIARTRNQPKCPLKIDWIGKM